MNYKRFLNKEFILSFLLFFLGTLFISSVIYGYYIAFSTPNIGTMLKQGYSINVKSPGWVQLFSLIFGVVLAYFVSHPKKALVFFLIALFLSLIAMIALARLLVH